MSTGKYTSLEEARKKGELDRFIKEHPIAERYTSGFACTECVRISLRCEKSRKRHKEWVANNPDYKAKKNAWTRNRQAMKLNATPSWANKEKMEELYVVGKYWGLEVDHIVPLNGDAVCGLHVENNLQLLTKTYNIQKSNKFDG